MDEVELVAAVEAEAVARLHDDGAHNDGDNDVDGAFCTEPASWAMA